MADYNKIHIGMTVYYHGFPMVVTGIFTTLSELHREGNDKDITLYLDFDDNEGDVWEVDIADISI